MADKCDICNVVEDIPHMLYYCRYAKIIWDRINLHSAIPLSAKEVILGINLNQTEVAIVTFISYYIYKKWLKFSFEGVPRVTETMTLLLKTYLQRLHDQYMYLHCQNICSKLSQIIQAL